MPKPRRTRARKVEAVVEAEPAAEEAAPAKPKRTRARKATAAEPQAVEAPAPEAPVEEAPAKPKRTRARKAAAVEAAPDPAVEAEAELESEAVAADGGAPRRGWWQRTFGE